MAKLITYFFSFLLISILSIRISPTLLEEFSIAFEKFDYDTIEKFGDKESSEPQKSVKNAEFIPVDHSLSFKTTTTEHIYYIFTPTIISSILEIPKRPPQKLS